MSIVSSQQGRLPTGNGSSQLPKDNVKILELTTLDLKGIEAFFAGLGATAAWASTPENLAIILDRSQGDPFYLQFLAKDILEQSLRKTDDLKNAPKGVKSYLDRWWDEISTSMGEGLLTDLMGYLAVAHGRLRRDELVDIDAEVP